MQLKIITIRSRQVNMCIVVINNNTVVFCNMLNANYLQLICASRN